MTTEQGGSEADVPIRASQGIWLTPFVIGCLWLVVGAGDLMNHRSLALLWLFFGGVWVALALRRQSSGIDLTPESATFGGARGRSISWPDVQAVVRARQRGASVVQLVLEDGELVTLPVPRTAWPRIGAAEYERDYGRIGHWWLAHRGESWRPVRPEAPQLPQEG